MAPRKKGRQAITRERIVDAALAIIDEQGLELLTMRRLGRRLGVDASSLYYHIPSQRVLLDLVADRIMSAFPDTPPVAPDSGPDEAIVAAGRAYLEALVTHPRALPLVTARPVRSLEVSGPFDGLLGMLYAAGLTPTRALSAAGAIGWFVLGAAQNRASQLLQPDYADDISSERVGTLSAERFPNIARLLAEAVPSEFDADFERGLTALVRGLLAAHATGR